MPTKPHSQTRGDRDVMIEDALSHITQAASTASCISADVDNGVNPKKLADAWAQVEQDLIDIRDRMSRLAR